MPQPMVGQQLLQLQLMYRKLSGGPRPAARMPRGTDRRTFRRTPTINARYLPTALPSMLLWPVELFAAPGSLQSPSPAEHAHTNGRDSPPDPRPRIHVPQGHALAPAPRPHLMLGSTSGSGSPPKNLYHIAALTASPPPAAPSPKHRQTAPTLRTSHYRQPSGPSTRPPSSTSPRTVSSQHQTFSTTSTH